MESFCNGNLKYLFLIFTIAIFSLHNANAESAKEYQVGVSLVNIGEIDKMIGTYDLDFWYSISSDTEDLIENTPPELDFLNGRIDSIQSEFSSQSIIEKRVSGKFTSEMDFRDFPFEKIKLQIIIEPQTQWSTENTVLVVNPSSGVDKSATIPGWYISDSNFIVKENSYGSDSKYSQYVAEFTIQRNVLGSFLKVIFPIVIILGISFVAYIIPKNYGIVAELSLLPLLALVFFHIDTLNQIPPLGYLTIFDKLMIVSYVLIANNVISTGRQVRAHEIADDNRSWHLNNWHLKITPLIIIVSLVLLYFV